MSDWTNVQLRVYDDFGRQIYYADDIIEAQGNRVWHEIGRGASASVPFFGANPELIFDRGRRVYITALNTATVTTHVIADFIIETTSIEEISLGENGYGTIIKISGRDEMASMGERPIRLRHISKYRFGGLPTAIGKTTLQMNAGDTAAYAGMSLIGWTVELEDGNWSEITGHTAGGLLTIDPAWQVNVDDEAAPVPPVQKFSLYGAAFTETTGNYTDLRLVMGAGNAAGKRAWDLHPQGYQSTANGSFVAPGQQASQLKALQLIAAQTGEYFARVPGERRIQWRREVPPLTHPQYGYPLTLVVSDTPNPISQAVIFPGAKLSYDTNERATRVRPTGAGSGDEVLTLKDLPAGFVVAAGYSLDGEYLVYNAGETGGDYVAQNVRFDGIGPASDSAPSRQLAAQALYNAAFLWLEERNDERLIFECEVWSAIPIEPVTYVYVTKIGHALNNKLMYVLDVTATYRDDQLLYKLQLSNKKSPIMTDERLMAEAIRQTDSQLFYINAPVRNSRMLDRRGSGGGGESDHEPVTAGNAAIGVAPGQVLSLVLAGPSGLEIADIGLRLADSVAGNGLGINNKILSINLAPHSGLQLVGDALGLGQPLNVGVDSSNQIAGSGHTHAVTSYANAKTTPAQVLRSDAFGDLTLRMMTADKVITPEIESTGAILLDPATNLIYADGNLSFVGARQIVTDTGSLTLAPAQTLIIDPPDDVMQINSAVTVRTAHAQVGVFPQTGWQANYNGAGYFTSLLADELHVQSFIADIMRVKVGGEYIPESMALISRDMVIPAVGSTTTLYIEDVPGWANIAAFADNDWILLRIVDRSGGGLTVANAWGQVTNYADLSSGEQSWTFTTRIATNAVTREARRGDLALDFGKSGSSWWYVTVLDKTGPHAGFGTWQGNNPTEGISYSIRLGQLHGVTGINEMGFQAGASLSSRTRISNLRNEIHGSRFSLFAGDGAQLRVAAADLLFYTSAAVFQTLVPNADHSSLNVISTGGTYYQTVDEGTTAPVLSDYIANAANTAGYVMLGLTNPTAFAGIYQIRLKYTLVAAGFVSDLIRLYAQVFQADEITPLTGEALVLSRSTNAGSIAGTVTLPHHDPAATLTEWSGARLRLRWEYDINANQEAIRLDPQVPSIAVGNPLPIGPAAGGDGFWVGRDAGLYKLRLGKAVGVGLDWTGTTLQIRNSANAPVIVAQSTGDVDIAGILTIATLGEIRQGTGTLGTNYEGIRLFNSNGKGNLAVYGSGNFAVWDNANGLIGGLQGFGGGGGLTNMLEISLQAYHASQNRGVSVLAMTGGAFSGLTANSGSVDDVKLYANNVIRLTAYDNGIDVTGVASISGGVRSLAGIVVGSSASLAIPQAGVLRLSERADNNTFPNSTQVDFFARTVGGVQKLYAKFGNGVVRELASAA